MAISSLLHSARARVVAMSLTLGVVVAATPRAPEAIVANDNRHAAGVLSNGVLTVTLEARDGLWQPEGETSSGVEVAAWAEEGKPPSVPGPLVRVPVGTRVKATLRNSLDKPLTVFGFGATRGITDSIVIPARGSRDVEFRAETAGTFYYLGRRGTIDGHLRFASDMELVGAIVVDPPGTPARSTDRVFVLSWWFEPDPTTPRGFSRAVMAINGLSWPHTERIDLTQGDSVHWRVVNMTESDHPMHLHGFYFRVNAKGDAVRDTSYAKEQQRLAVTELAGGFSTMALSFLPDRSGNWLYHCHFPDHVSSVWTLDRDKSHVAMQHHASDAPHEMFGLVLGLRVAPKGPAPTLAEAPRRVRMIVRQKERTYGAHPGYSIVLGGTPDERDPNAMPVPGPTLALERGKPVAITVVNRAAVPTSIHWHGVELESYSDGVPGWSGAGSQTLPAIRPGDSLTVRWTPPRAGTFMYHSHFDEEMQISSGVFGPIIVLDPGVKYDAETDRVLFVSTGGPSINLLSGPFAHHRMNGRTQPEAMNLRVGTRYRLRLINLADHGPVLVSLVDGSEPVMWKAVAKDGATLPPSQATLRPASLVFDAGEIYDFELTPAKAGDLAFTFGPLPTPPGVVLPFELPPRRSVVVRVRP
jgi:FtsP/CotA-like multicopper oxidase with cupredoxin domain